MNLKIAENQSDFFSCMLIRSRVFMIEQNVDISLELDEDDKTCTHYCLYDDNGTAIGTCRILDNGDTAHLGRVAILKEYRQKGCGAFMISEVEKSCKMLGYKKVELGAQLHALPFYEKQGYHAYGEIFMDADIEHRMMVKEL